MKAQNLETKAVKRGLTVNEAKATQRPWTIEEDLTGNQTDRECLVICDNLHDQVVATAHFEYEDGHPNGAYPPHSIAKANAELIVRAVNCHDELVKQLELRILECQTMERPNNSYIKELKDLLSRAKGAF